MTINVSITTPITLLEYAKTMDESSPTRTFVENMVQESDLMAAIPFLPAQNGKREFLDISRLPNVGFRGINEPGNEDTGNFNLREEDTFFIDEYVKVDRAIVDRLGMAHRYRQEKLKTIALAQNFSQNLIKSDTSVNARQPTGMQARCNTLNTNLLHNSVASGGGALSLQNLDTIYWMVNKPTHWVFPRSLMPFVDAAARSNSLTNQTFGDGKDDFGRNIKTYKGLPILYGYDPDDTPDLLPFSEVGAGGGSAVTSSIYCASLRDGGFYAIEQTPLSVEDEGIMKGTPFFSTHIKWDWGVAKEHPRSVARLTSITAATIVA